MKIRSGFLLRQVGDQNVVVPIGEESRDFNGIIRLNDTGSFLWENLQSETDKKTLVEAMLLEYDIDEATAAADVESFVETLSEAGLLG